MIFLLADLSVACLLLLAIAGIELRRWFLFEGVPVCLSHLRLQYEASVLFLGKDIRCLSVSWKHGCDTSLDTRVFRHTCGLSLCTALWRKGVNVRCSFLLC